MTLTNYIFIDQEECYIKYENDEELLFERICQEVVEIYFPALKLLEEQPSSEMILVLSPFTIALLAHSTIQEKIRERMSTDDGSTAFEACRHDILATFKRFITKGQITLCLKPLTGVYTPWLLTKQSLQAQISDALRLCQSVLGCRPSAFYFPFSHFDDVSDCVMRENGVHTAFLGIRRDHVETQQLHIHVSSLQTTLVCFEEANNGDVMTSCYPFINGLQHERERVNPQKEIHITEQNEWIVRALHFMERTIVELANDPTYRLDAKTVEFTELVSVWMLLSHEMFLKGKNDLSGFNAESYFISLLTYFKTLAANVRQDRTESYVSPLPKWLSYVARFYDLASFRHPSLQPFAPPAKKEGMNILMLSWEFPPLVVGGLARHVFDLSRALVDLGHNVYVITAFVEGLPSYERLYGVHIYRVRSLQPHHQDFLLWVSSLNVAMMRQGMKLGKQVSFHLVHAHDWLVGEATEVLAEHLAVPFITTIHATEHGRNNGIFNELQKTIHQKEERLVKQSDALIVCSQYMKEELTRLFYVPEEKISIFPNGIDPNMMISHTKHSQLKKKHELSQGPMLFSIGRIVYEKGFQTIIEAAETLVEKYSTIQFVIAGKGPLLAELRQLVSDKQLQRTVLFVGYISDDERNQFLSLADYVLFPSLYEPFGIVALEGMVANKPTIVSDTGGLKGIVEHGVTGLKMTPGSSESLCEQIEWLMRDANRAAEMASRGKKHAITEFSWNKVAIDTSELFSSEIGHYRNGKGIST